MKDKHIFIDTNILVYAHDKDAGDKGERARHLIEDAWNRPYPPALSVQVLQEFNLNMSRRVADRTSVLKATRNYLQWEIVTNDQTLLESGFEVQERWKLSFWDSLIVAAALRAKAEVLITEDLQQDQKFDSLTVFNPFMIV